MKLCLQEHFVDMDKEAIMSIPLSTQIQDDFYAWHYERKVSFTVRSAYRMLVAIKKQREDWLEKKPSGSHLHQRIVKKDHLQNFLSKKTLSRWRQVWPTDMWYVSPLAGRSRHVAWI
jgi:hypothetical protein